MKTNILMFALLFFPCCHVPAYGLEPAWAGGHAPVDADITSVKQRLPEAASLHVVITGITEQRGVVRLALYSSREDYEARENACCSKVIPVNAARVEVVFNDLKPGWYAVMLYHDINDNNQCDRILGLPREPFGISNNVRPGLKGTPDFREARFMVEPGKYMTVEISLQEFL